MSLNILLQVVVYIALKNISIMRWPLLTKRIRKQIIKANSHLSDIPYEKIFKVLFKDSLYFFVLFLSPPLKMAIIHKKRLFFANSCSLTLKACPQKAIKKNKQTNTCNNILAHHTYDLKVYIKLQDQYQYMPSMNYLQTKCSLPL